jgi:hypothetical protein
MLVTICHSPFSHPRILQHLPPLDVPPAQSTPSPSSVSNNNRRSLLLAQLNSTPLVRRVQRRIEEIAHIINDGTHSDQFGKRAGSRAVEGSGEGAGFDELGSER